MRRQRFVDHPFADETLLKLEAPERLELRKITRSGGATISSAGLPMPLVVV